MSKKLYTIDNCKYFPKSTAFDYVKYVTKILVI